MPPWGRAWLGWRRLFLIPPRWQVAKRRGFRRRTSRLSDDHRQSAGHAGVADRDRGGRGGEGLMAWRSRRLGKTLLRTMRPERSRPFRACAAARIVLLERDRGFADSPLERRVSCELVSEMPNSLLAGKIQGTSPIPACGHLGGSEKAHEISFLRAIPYAS